MKTSRYSVAQIIATLRQAEGGVPVADATEAWKGFKDDKVTLASGETVKLNRAKKVIHSWMRGGMNRSDLVPHLPEIIANAVAYGRAANFKDPVGPEYVNALAHIIMDGKNIAVRLILQDVGDGVLRQYQIEVFEAASTPANNLQCEDLQMWGQGDATSMSEAQAVSAFKPDRRLFQKNQGGSVPSTQLSWRGPE